jgi:hypothetical protein
LTDFVDFKDQSVESKEERKSIMVKSSSTITRTHFGIVWVNDETNEFYRLVVSATEEPFSNACATYGE